jgi:heme A synthase
VSLWLLGCALLVLAMIFIGGVTRLTHAGLSITEWKPILGAIPPLNGAAWQEEFARYQRSPEFRLINASMGLPEFQRIYLIEYTHRLLGRLATVHFLHRLLALGASTLLLVAWWSWRSRLRGRLALALWWTIPSLLVLQILFGAATVLFHVPLPIAVAHQTNGAMQIGALGALLSPREGAARRPVTPA